MAWNHNHLLLIMNLRFRRVVYWAEIVVVDLLGNSHLSVVSLCATWGLADLRIVFLTWLFVWGWKNWARCLPKIQLASLGLFVWQLMELQKQEQKPLRCAETWKCPSAISTIWHWSRRTQGPPDTKGGSCCTSSCKEVIIKVIFLVKDVSYFPSIFLMDRN